MSDDVDLSSRFGELLALASDRFERVVIVLDNLDLMMGIKQVITYFQHIYLYSDINFVQLDCFFVFFEREEQKKFYHLFLLDLLPMFELLFQLVVRCPN